MKLDAYKPDVERVWVCQECGHAFADEELRIDYAEGIWGHICGEKGTRCEAFLVPHMPEPENTERNVR